MNFKFTVSSLVLLSSLCLSTTPGLALTQQSEGEIAQVNSSQEEKRAEALRLVQQGVQSYQQGTLESLQEAISKWKQALSIVRNIGDRGVEAVTLSNLGRVYDSLGEKQQALDYYNSERGKARTLLDLLTEANIDIRKGVEPKLVSQERRLRIKLDSIEQRRVELCNQGCNLQQINQLDQERAELLDQYRQIQSQIRATSPAYAELTQPEPLKLKQLQKLLDQDTVLLQYSL